jgi:O-antigen/teichoic acid export membrane protein
VVANERSILRNTLFAAAGRGGGDLCTFLFVIALARVYGSDALGQLSLGMAVGAVLALFVTLGINTLLVREIAKRPGEAAHFVGVVAALQLAVAAAALAVLVTLAALLAADEAGRQILLIMGLYQLVYALSQIFSSYFRAREQTQYAALLEAGHKAGILGLGLIALAIFPQPQMVLLVYPLAALGAYAAGYLLMKSHQAAPRLRLDLSLSYEWFVASLPLFALNAIAVLELRAGFIYLGSVADAGVVGLYAAADRLAVAASLGISMFASAILPVMSRLSASRIELDALLGRCLRMAMLFSAPVATIIVLLREPIIMLVFGEAFLPSATPLGVLVAAMVPASISSVIVMLLTARGLLGALLKIRLAALALYVGAMLVCVPAIGFVGLAWSVLVSKIFACVMFLIYMHRCGHTPRLRLIARGPLAACAGMIAAYWFADALAPAARIAGTLAAGLAALILFRGVEAHDLAYFRRIVGRGE